MPVQITIADRSVTVAGPASATGAQSAAHVSGENLAELLVSEDTIKAQMAGVFQSIAAQLRTDPTYRNLEEEHPGLIDAVAFAMSTELRRAALARLPELWREMGSIYDDTLSAAEERQALEFYRSPAGMWLISQMKTAAGMADLTRQRLADQTREVTSDDLKALTDSNTTKLAATMSPEQREALSAFTYSPLGEKIRTLKPRLREAQAAWANARSPALAARLQSVTADTIRKFSASSENQKEHS